MSRRLALAATALLTPALALPGGVATAAAPATPAALGSHPRVVHQPNIEVAAAAPDDTRGQWRVETLGDGRWTVTWVSPVPLPITNARPELIVDGSVLGAPQLAADGRTLTLEVTAAERPQPADLDVLLSGELLDSTQPAGPASPAPATYTEPPTLGTLPVDPGLPGDHEVVSSDYRLPGLPFRGLPAKIEVLGHVVSPADAAATSPLVLFLHGRHSVCYGKPTDGRYREWPCPNGMQPIPSYLGYDYIQRRLASQGYVTVSISANGINAQDWRLPDGGAGARSALIRHHLARWAAWAESPEPRYLADARNVVLVGHSRGGEGANRASLMTPRSAPYRISGQVLIGPTDFARQATPYVHTVTVLPYCDGDVIDLQGQQFTDVARDIAADDTALHSSALMMGTNHNFFNTEWTPGISAAPSWDDWGGNPNATCGTNTDERLTAAEQRQVGRTYVAGAVHLMADREQVLLAMFDGSHVRVPSAGAADVRTHLVGAGRDVRRMGADATTTPVIGTAEEQMCVGRLAQRSSACGRQPRLSEVQAPHWIPSYARGLIATRNFEMGWDAANEWGRIRLREPLDLSSAPSLDLRTIVDPLRGNVRLDVRLRDADGGRMLITPELAGRLPALPGGSFGLAKRWAQTLRVPLDGAGPVDLSRVVAIDMVGRSVDGRVFVLDLAATRSTLPPTPRERAAIISFGDVRVDEGDGPNDTLVEVPYRVRGQVPAHAEVLVVLQDPMGFQKSSAFPMSVTERRGEVTIPVEADRRDDRTLRMAVAAYPRRNLMTGRYTARVTILDDDPTPVMTVTRPLERITEGSAAVWQVQLSAPADYWVSVIGRFVAGNRDLPRLRVGDLRPKWVERRLGRDLPPNRLLHRLQRPRLWFLLKPGDRKVDIKVPVRLDGNAEATELVALRVRFGDQTSRQPVLVRDR